MFGVYMKTYKSTLLFYGYTFTAVVVLFDFNRHLSTYTLVNVCITFIICTNNFIISSGCGNGLSLVMVPIRSAALIRVGRNAIFNVDIFITISCRGIIFPSPGNTAASYNTIQ